jgi:hypothetical protein
MYENAREGILQSKRSMGLEGLYLMNAVGYGPRDLGFDYRQRQFFLSTKPPRPAIRLTQSPIQSLQGFLPRGKAAGWHSPASSAADKNDWSYTSVPPRYTFMSWTRTNYEISGYHRGVVEASALLGRYLMYVGSFF